MYDKQGNPRGSVSAFIEITERKQAEEALQKSEEKYRGLFNFMGEAIQLCELVFDEEGQPVDNIILDVNPAYEKQTGIKREQVVGRRIKDILPVVEQIWLDRYGEVVRTGSEMHFDEYNSSLDKWFEVFASPMGGNRFAAVFSDITERKEAEKALQKAHDSLEEKVKERTAELEKAYKSLEVSEEKYRNIVETANEGIWVIDAESKTTYVNEKMAEMLGYSPEEMIGRLGMDFTDEEGKALAKLNVEKRQQGVR